MTLGISFSYGFVKFVNFASIIFIFLFSVKNIEAKDMADVWDNSMWIFIFVVIFRNTGIRISKEKSKYDEIPKNPANKLSVVIFAITFIHIIMWIIHPEINFARPTMVWLGMALLSILLMCYYDWKLKLYLLPKKEKK